MRRRFHCRSIKKEVLERSTDETPADYLRYLIGADKLGFSPQEEGGLGNHNDVVNPDGRLWRWTSVADYTQETGTRPWC
jgi:hypothetical protein